MSQPVSVFAQEKDTQAQSTDPVPRGDPGLWVGPQDYPVEALRNEEEGVTRFVLTVAATGKAQNCKVTGSSGSSALDMETCKVVMQRSRFHPALNEDGEKVTGTWSSAIRWEIPDNPSYTWEADGQSIASEMIGYFIVEKDGSMSACEIFDAEANPYYSHFCEEQPEGYRLYDDAGQPVKAAFAITVDGIVIRGIE